MEESQRFDGPRQARTRRSAQTDALTVSEASVYSGAENRRRKGRKNGNAVVVHILREYGVMAAQEQSHWRRLLKHRHRDGAGRANGTTAVGSLAGRILVGRAPV
jgi:hypothetical protein